MPVSIQEVENIAKLAKLAFSEEEKIKFTRHFNQILTYMEKLNELDTTEISPTLHVNGIKNVMRPDKAEESMNVDDILSNAPNSKSGCFSVPKVIG